MGRSDGAQTVWVNPLAVEFFDEDHSDNEPRESQHKPVSLNRLQQKRHLMLDAMRQTLGGARVCKTDQVKATPR